MKTSHFLLVFIGFIWAGVAAPAQDTITHRASLQEVAKRSILKVDTIATEGEGGSRYNLQELTSMELGIQPYQADSLEHEIAVQVLGYYVDANGDPDGVFEGRGIFRMVHDGSLVANGGTIIAADYTFDSTRTSLDAFWVLSDEEQVYAANVKHFGAVGDAVTDDSTAFQAAWDFISATGGTVIIPPGEYMLDSQWNCERISPLRWFRIEGYGAHLHAGPSVTGHALRVANSGNNFGTVIEGLSFNHRGNSTVAGCIEAYGTSHLKILNCSVEAHDTRADYKAISLTYRNIGDPTTHSFWAEIDHFTTRKRSGADGANMEYGIYLDGAANATKVTNCSFSSVNYGIRIGTDGTNAGIANSVRIINNDFEAIGTAILIDTNLPANLTPAGLYVAFNRVEVADTFVEWTGPSVANHSHTPVFLCNYLVGGAVTDYMLNPTNRFVNTFEPTTYGSAGAINKLGGASDFEIVTQGGNLKIGNLAGDQTYTQGHLVLGDYHVWVDVAGDLRIKNGPPSSSTDGVVVGNQN
jgi:hypothetical protein